jgi:hypothetical protein
VLEVVAEAVFKSELGGRAPFESTKMEIWIWMQLLVLVDEESLEKAASNHLCHLDRKVLEEEEQQDLRGEEIPEQPNMPSSEVYEGNKPISGKAASRQMEPLFKSMA